MPSVLKVNEIQNTQNLTAMEVDSSGRVFTPARPAFAADKNGNFNTNITSTKLTGWTENFDTGGCWDNANSKFVAPVAGLYQFNYSGLHHSGAGGTGNYVAVRIVLNGNENILDLLGDQGTYGVYQRVSGAIAWELSADDYIEIWVRSANSSGYVFGSGSYTVFSGYLVG